MKNFSILEITVHTHMYGEVLVKPLSMTKRCYQRTPNLLFASHESDNHW